MEIHLDKRAVKLIRLSAQDAIEEGDTEALREDIYEAFSEEQVEELERRLASVTCARPFRFVACFAGHAPD